MMDLVTATSRPTLIDKKFTVKKVLGQGGSSRVYLTQDDQHRQFAIKILRKDKNYSYERGTRILQKEHWILKKLSRHPNVLKSYYCNPDGTMVNNGKKEDIMYNILEHAENGPISHFVRITGWIEEELVRFMFLQLSDAVRYMHSHKYSHLDIKLENILLDKYFNIKLADMGVSHQLSDDSPHWNIRRGTIHYMAPEISDLQKDDYYDAKKADIYSLGVWLYILLVGDFPDTNVLNSNSFNTNDSTLEGGDGDNCLSDQLSTKKWNKLSDNARNLILQMLLLEPYYRPSIEEVLYHPWLQEPFSEETQSVLYSEMLDRKEFLDEYFRKKQKSS